MALPVLLRQAGEQHQIERVMLGVRAAAEVVAEQKDGLAESDCDAQFHHHPLIGRRSVHDGEQRIGIPHVLNITLGHAIGPAGFRQIHLTIAGEGLPDLQPKGFKRLDEFRQQQSLPLFGESIRRGEVNGLCRHHTSPRACR